MTALRRWGGLAGFYMALAYAVAIVIFLVVLDYASISDPAQKVALLADNPTIMAVSNLLLFVLFGPVLAVFALALYSLLQKDAPELSRLALAIGIVWTGLLIASGLVANAAIGPVTALYLTDPAAAILLWSVTDAVANGLGGGEGEVAGGLMTLLFGIAGLRSASFARLLAWLGIVVGAIGLVSALPGLHDLGGLFGITQIVWFLWCGLVLLRS